jgi:hypothetical protein
MLRQAYRRSGWRPAQLLEGLLAERGLDRLKLVDPFDWAHRLNPSGVEARGHAIQLIETVVTVFRHPQDLGYRVERHAEAVSQTVGKDPLNVGARLASHLRSNSKERIVRRSCAIRIQSNDDTCEMRIVRRRTAELIVGDGIPETRRGWAGRKILQFAAPSVVANNNVKLSVGPEAQNAGVVIACRQLHAISLVRRLRVAIILVRM